MLPLILFFVAGCYTPETEHQERPKLKPLPPLPPTQRKTTVPVSEIAHTSQPAPRQQNKPIQTQIPPSMDETIHVFKTLVVLPVKAEQNARWIREGMVKALRKLNRTLLKNTRIVDSKDFSEFVRRTPQINANFIVGGYLPNELQILHALAKQSLIPTIALSEGTRLDSTMFFAYPNSKDLARTILEELKYRGHKKVALGFTSTEEKLAQRIRQMAVDHDIEITKWGMYPNGDFGSIDRFLRDILELDPAKRAEEFKELQARQAQGKQEVLLPPKPAHDAFIVLDEARIVRHIAKILAFYGARDFVLAGASSWRADELTQSPDPLMGRSFFVDFLPLYTDFAKNIGENDVKDEFYIDAEKGKKLEFLWVGYHLGHALHRIASMGAKTKSELIRRLSSREGSPLGAGVAPLLRREIFDADGQLLWPVEVFNVRQDRLIPVSR